MKKIEKGFTLVELLFERLLMRKSAVRFAVSAVAVLGAWFAPQAFSSEPILVRQATNGRIWQVNLAPGDLIKWAWVTGSDAAKITATNKVTGAVAEQIVTRTDDAVFGSYALAVPSSPVEQVVTLAIEQYYHYGQSTQKTIDSASARIAYLPGIHGGAIDVKSSWNSTHGTATVFAYDSAWSASSASATSASLTFAPVGGEAVTYPLSGTSGYDTITLGALAGRANVSLEFDGVTTFTAQLGRTGLLLFVR